MIKHLKRWMGTAAVVLCCLLAMSVCLTALQRQITESGQRASQTRMLEEIRQMTVSYTRTEEEIQRSFDEVYKSKAKTLAYMVVEGIDAEPGSDEMKSYRDMLEVSNALLLDRQGNILAGAEASPSVFTQKRFNQLRTVFSKGEPSRAFTVDTDKGPRRYYGARIDEERMAVIEQSPGELTALLSKRTGMENLMSHMRLGSSGYACAIRAQDYSILYHPDAELVERDAIAEGLTEEALTDGYSGEMTLGGEEIYASVARQGDLYILCAMPKKEMNDASHRMVSIVMLIFGVVVLLIGAYAVFLQDAQEEKDTHGSGHITGKVSVLSAIGLLAVFIASFYVQTLYGVSQISVAGMRHIGQIEETLAKNEEDMEQLRELYSVSYLSKCRAAAYILQKKPSLGTRAKLQKLSEALDVEAIYLYNRDGELDATSTPYSNLRISHEPQDQSFAFNKLLMGLDHLVQEAVADEITGEYRQYIGVSMRDEEGNANGLVQISLVPEKLGQAVVGFELPAILSTIRFEREGYAFAVDKSDGTILYHPQRKYIGLPAVNCGMEPYELRGEYCGYMTFGSEKLFTVSLETEEALIYAAMRVESLEDTRMAFSLMTTGVSLACMALLLSLQDSAHNRAERRRLKEKAKHKIRLMRRDGAKREEHREHRDAHQAWSGMSPERRVLTLLRSILGMAAGFSFVALLFGDWIFDENSIFFYIVGGNWRKGFNIFSLTASLMVVCAVCVLTNLLSRLLRMIARNFDAHTATLCHLMTSCIKYISVLGMVCFCLALVGVDMKDLLASFGLVTAALTFGAKESVADIIAGLFIIFENEFHVDDFVTIDGWRGRVLEIGIRTTKVESDEGDIKIFANSSVRGVVNMTKENSIAICMLCVDYRESLERVEGILREELPRMAERIPEIRRGPVYKGVPEMQDSGVQLRIDAYCTEKDRPQVIRSLNRELKIMCDKWKISIPFPQVVLNAPDSFDNLPEAGKKEHEISDTETKEGTEDKTA